MPDLLIEIGCEELPASACREAESQLPALFSGALDAAGLPAGKTRVLVSPRRLGLLAFGLPAERAAEPREVRGPRADAPEAARAGFARKHGVDSSRLVERDGVLWVIGEGAATPAAELVSDIPAQLVDRLQFSKTMRWGSGRFSRPIRWLAVKLDEQVIPASVAGLESRETYSGPGTWVVSPPVGHAAGYAADLRGVHVVVDQAERAELIEQGLNARGEWIDPMKKLSEVTHLVEWPVVLEGRFDERYLALPPRVTITAMQSHQRYFPVAGKDHALEPRFLFVANGAAHPEIVIAGNEEVLVGRLQDAAFAYEKDLSRGLPAMVAELDRVSFLEGGGSMAEKAGRVRAAAEQLADRTDAAAETKAAVLRAAELCKADLVSNLVAEFSDLQGYACSVYARAAGEPDAVAARSRSTTGRWRRGASCPEAEPAHCWRWPTRWIRSPSHSLSVRSPPAAATPTAFAVLRPGSSRSRWSASSSWGLPS